MISRTERIRQGCQRAFGRAEGSKGRACARLRVRVLGEGGGLVGRLMKKAHEKCPLVFKDFVGSLLSAVATCFVKEWDGCSATVAAEVCARVFGSLGIFVRAPSGFDVRNMGRALAYRSHVRADRGFGEKPQHGHSRACFVVPCSLLAADHPAPLHRPTPEHT